MEICMALYVVSRSGIEVVGTSLLGLMEAIGPYAWIAKKILSQSRIYTIQTESWYPIEPYLDVYKALAERFGEHTLFSIGKKVPEGVTWPPHIKSIEDGLASIDVAYHLNHRLDGEAMLDLETGVMKEGIGHYRLEGIEGRRAVMVCDTPFPSDFDRGIITTMVRMFRPLAEVVLDEGRGTRKRGGDSCTYVVTW